MTRERPVDRAVALRRGVRAGRGAVVGCVAAIATGCSWMPAGTAPRDDATRPSEDYLSTPAWVTAPRRSTAAPRASERAALGPVREATPLETREYAMPGRALLTPVRIALREGAFAQDEPADYVTLVDAEEDAPAIDVRSDDGVELPSELFWIGGSFDLSAPRAWLAPSGAWRAETLREAAALGRAGTWSLAIDLRGAERTSAVWIDGKRVALTWIDVPGAGAGAIPGERGVVEATMRTALRQALAPERGSPLRRWRARLTLERFGAPQGGDGFGNSALELMAQQEEDRWRAALSRLARIDEALARRALHALTAVVVFEGGSVAPAWSEDGVTLAHLRTDLLDPQLSDREARLRVEGWLSAQARAAAWIVDDAIATRHVAVGVASMLDEPASASAEFGGVDLRPLAPGTSAALIVEASDVGGNTAIDVRIGDWRQTVYAMKQPIPCAPPGTLMGPFLHEYTMSAWLDGDAAGAFAPTPEWSSAALLQRRAGGEGWELLIECRTPERITPTDDDGSPTDDAEGAETSDQRPDFVRVWIGPGGGALAALRVDSRGFVVDEAAGASARAGARPIDVRIDADRWSALLPIPERYTTDGALLIGLERIDARGVRTTWPRPTLPWQTAPGRVEVDLSVWRGLERAAPIR